MKENAFSIKFNKLKMFPYLRVYSRRICHTEKNMSISAVIFQDSCLFLRCVFQTKHSCSHILTFLIYAVFLSFYTVDSSSNSKLKRICIHRLFREFSLFPVFFLVSATPFAVIISGLAIICGPIWGSFTVLRSFAGLYSTQYISRLSST